MYGRLLVLALVAMLSACASARQQVLRPGLLDSTATYLVELTYTSGEVETRTSSVGVERRVVDRGQPGNFLAFRDAVVFELAELRIRTVHEITDAEFVVQLTPSLRIGSCVNTCGAIDGVSIVLAPSNDTSNPVARILVENGSRANTTKYDQDMARYVAEQIVSLIEGR